MNVEQCPHEEAVTLAVRTGQGIEALQTHISQCRDCAEIERVMRWMGGLAADLEFGQKLPDPGLAWLKAQLDERRRLEERALRPVVIARTVVQFGLWAALFLLTLWAWPAVNGLIGRLQTAAIDATLDGLAAALTSARASSYLLLLAIVLGCIHLHSTFRRAIGRN